MNLQPRHLAIALGGIFALLLIAMCAGCTSPGVQVPAGTRIEGTALGGWMDPSTRIYAGATVLDPELQK